MILYKAQYLFAHLLCLSIVFDGAFLAYALPAIGDEDYLAAAIALDHLSAARSTIDGAARSSMRLTCKDPSGDCDFDHLSASDIASDSDDPWNLVKRYDKSSNNDESVSRSILDETFIKTVAERLPNPVPRDIRPFFKLTTTKKLLIFDLDETLIYTASTDDGNGMTFDYRTRPGLKFLIQTLAKYFELGIWTAAEKDYADRAIFAIGLDEFFPMTHRIYRHTDNLCFEGVKPLTALGFDMRNVVMVDNLTSNFKRDSLSLDDGNSYATNGIKVMDVRYRWTLDSGNFDKLKVETLGILGFLMSIKDVPDVRPFILRRNKLKGTPIDYDEY